jgi:HEAT repeat protein
MNPSGPSQPAGAHPVDQGRALVAMESLDDWRWKARRVLARFGTRTVPALVEALSARDDPAVRQFAAESLAYLGPQARDASEALHRVAWHDDDPTVRAAAAAALDAVGEGGDRLPTMSGAAHTPGA